MKNKKKWIKRQYYMFLMRHLNLYVMLYGISYEEYAVRMEELVNDYYDNI